ncbi:MAG: trypsin-like peptidase domain-containing protein [Planctomycetota bacterium]
MSLPTATQRHADEHTALLETIQAAFESLANRMAPSVVTIRADRRADRSQSVGPWAEDPQSGVGAGVILDEKGAILTSQHVIEEAVAIHVTLHDGRRLHAKTVAADRRADLAVIRVHAEGLAPAEFGDARNLHRGHIVLVMGNPLGLSIDGQVAISQGVVAAVGRPLPETFGRQEDRYYGDMVQTTARIGPGNSGGPLIDIHGRVVGIVTAMCARSSETSGFGFAVPIDARTKALIDKLVRGQRIEYGYLGIRVGCLDEAARRAAGLTANEGVLLDAVLEGDPAQRAGLRKDDIIVAVDGRLIQSPDELIQRIGAAPPDKPIEIGFVRDGLRRTVGVRVVARHGDEPPGSVSAPTISFRGAVLGCVDPPMRAVANLPAQALLVLVVNEDTPAQRSGLMPGDIVVRLEGEPLPPDAGARFAGLRDDVLLGLANGGSVLVKAE